VHVVFTKDSPNAASVRRIIHAKRRGYADFLHAAHALIDMSQWHHPEPYLYVKPRNVASRFANPDHYPEWNTEHHAYAQRDVHLVTVSLFIDQIADPIRGRGRRLDTQVDAARVAHDERRSGGHVTAVSRARMNLRSGMLAAVAKALTQTGPYHAQFMARRQRKRGPTALGYTRDEIDALGTLWTRAYTALEAVQNAVRHNELWADPGPADVPALPMLTTRPHLPDIDGTGLAPRGFSFALDDDTEGADCGES
jgi:hypothetical protein